MLRNSLIIALLASALTMITGCSDASKSQAVKPGYTVDDLPPEERVFELIRQGDLAKVKEQVSANPEVLTATDTGGMTPLHVAAAEGKADIVQFLIESGCDASAPDDFGQTPIDLAKTGGQTAVVKVLEAAAGGGGGEAQ